MKFDRILMNKLHKNKINSEQRQCTPCSKFTNIFAIQETVLHKHFLYWLINLPWNFINSAFKSVILFQSLCFSSYVISYKTLYKFQDENSHNLIANKLRPLLYKKNSKRKMKRNFSPEIYKKNYPVNSYSESLKKFLENFNVKIPCNFFVRVITWMGDRENIL